MNNDKKEQEFIETETELTLRRIKYEASTYNRVLGALGLTPNQRWLLGIKKPTTDTGKAGEPQNDRESR